MRCPRFGECRDAEHCLQGGRCADAVGPVDLAAVQADDVLLDQVGADEPVPGTDLTRELVPWRHEIHQAGAPVLIDTDQAQAAIRSAQDSVAVLHRRRSVREVICVVIALALMVGAAVGLVAVDAAPGDWLYPVRELLYSPAGR